MNIIIIIFEAAVGSSLSIPVIVGFFAAMVAAVMVFALAISGITAGIFPWLSLTPALLCAAFQSPTYLIAGAAILLVSLGVCVCTSKMDIPPLWVSAGLAVAGGIGTVIVAIVGALLTGSANIFEVILVALLGVPILTVVLYPTACVLTVLCSLPALAYEPAWWIEAVLNLVLLLAAIFFVQALGILAAGWFDNVRTAFFTIDFSPASTFLGPFHVPYGVQNVIYTIMNLVNATPPLTRLLVSGAAFIPCAVFAAVKYR